MIFSKRTTVLVLAAFAALVISCGHPESSPAGYINNPAPLHPNRFIELPLGSISAEGWLKEMLIRQKNGATGHLDEIYPQVMGPRNGWLGGDGDQWERGPYWIDGLLPLAYILDDDELKAKVKPWVEWILSSSKENGQFGPCTDYAPEKGLQRSNCQDWWPRMVALKILQQHYSATGDDRVIKLMTDYFKYQLSVIREQPLDNWTFWARHRGSENLNSIYWLYSITKDDFLIELGDIIYTQTEPFTEMFLAHDKLTRVGTIHSVNLAQGIKTPIVYWQYDRNPKYLEALECAMDDLDRFQGYPNGMFSGDEAIHGNDPTQGIELCEIVEYMYSLEVMYRITGNPRFAEKLERVAFNALPAQTTDDYMARQYFQQVNQISVMERASNFDVNHSGLDGCFGLLTGYPCCTSNMHQGWPKFTQNLWYATPEGLAKPFVKWAGGKGGLLDCILPLVPKEFNAYFEPFLGGGALFFALQHRGALTSITLSDKNAELINAYQAIKQNPHKVLRELESLQKSHSKEQFYHIRNLDRRADFANLDLFFRAGRFIYLNKTCFNGLCRYNARGEFNTPMGSYKNPKIYDEALILGAHNALQNAQILSDDFERVCEVAQRGDFVYFDPPYFPLNKTSSFVGYTDSFLQDEQLRLCKAFKILESRGVKVLQSNSNTEFIREIYKDFEIIEVKAKRAINCKGDKRGEISELLIRNF